MRKYYDGQATSGGGGEQPDEQNIPEEELERMEQDAYDYGKIEYTNDEKEIAYKAYLNASKAEYVRHLSQKNGEESHNLRKQIEEQRTMHNKDIKNLEKQLEDATIHLKEKSLSNRLLREKKGSVLRDKIIWQVIEKFQGERLNNDDCYDNETWSDRVLSYNDVEATLYEMLESLPEDTSEPLTDKK